MPKRRKRAFVVGFDSEDDGKGTPFLWAFTSREGTYWTRYRDDALAWLRNLARDRERRGEYVEAWATNLEYDLVNLFDPSRVEELVLRFGRTCLCGATWGKIEFRDTMRHVPISVAQWGELVGLAKRERTMFAGKKAPTFNQYLTRCQRDATITYRGAMMLHGTYRHLGERPRMTLASTALNLWRSRYWSGGIRRPEPVIWNAALGAYHGGRTQAFAVGRFPTVRVIDVASMFPWAMTATPLPVPWGLTRRVRPGDEPHPFGLYDVTVTSDTARPSLPVRTRDGTIYPNGRWRGWYVGEELRAAAELGNVAFTVHDGYIFAETCKPFVTYVRSMFRRKQRARGGSRLMYKLLLNALYGKFGQQGKRVYAVPIEKLLTMKDPPVAWRPWNGLAIFTKDGLPPPWGNNVWAAWTTARARVRLAQEMARLDRQDARVLYCDTDSVIYQGQRGRYPAKARSIGQFELRGEFSRALIVGKKEYALQPHARAKWDIHVKGVPMAERMSYLQRGHASFVRPVRIREASRTGEQANVWRRVEKQRRRDLRKRATADGTLPVPVITGAVT